MWSSKLTLLLVCAAGVASGDVVVRDDALVDQMITQIEHADSLSLYGKYEESGMRYEAIVSMGVNTTDPRALQLTRSSEIQAHNLLKMNFDMLGVSDQSSKYVSGVEFGDLNTIVQESLKVVKDYDDQIRCLRDIQAIDEVFLVQQVSIEKGETERHLQELNQTMNHNKALVVGLSSELVTLQDQYQSYFASLADHIATAVTTEADKIEALTEQIQHIQDASRRKAIIGGIFAGLQIIAGAAACVLGAPEIGAPLIIGGVTKAVDTAQGTLDALPPIAAAEQEISWCRDAIADLKQLVVDVQNMNRVWGLVTHGYQESTFANQLPEIFSLRITSDSFSAYLTAFQSNLVITAGSAGSDVVLDASMLREVISLSIVALNEFYHATMEVQHTSAQALLYEQRAESLSRLSDNGAESVNILDGAVSLLHSRRRLAAEGVVKALAMQRRQFGMYSLADQMNNNVHVSAFLDDTIALQSASAANLQMILEYDARQTTSPQSCWTELKLNTQSSPAEIAELKATGELSFFLQPPDNVFAYNAFVTDLQVVMQGLPAGSATASTASNVKIAVVKGAGEVRVNEKGKTMRFVSDSQTRHLVYDKATSCPLSDSSSTKSATASQLVGDGRNPSLYGAWKISSGVSQEQLQKVSAVTVQYQVSYSARSAATGTNLRLFQYHALDGSQIYSSDGLCGAVSKSKCAFHADSLTSSTCNTAAQGSGKEPTNWVWVTGGFLGVLALLLVLNVWLVHRIRHHDQEVARAASLSVARSRMNTETSQGMDWFLEKAVDMEESMRVAQSKRSQIKGDIRSSESQ